MTENIDASQRNFLKNLNNIVFDHFAPERENIPIDDEKIDEAIAGITLVLITCMQLKLATSGVYLEKDELVKEVTGFVECATIEVLLSGKTLKEDMDGILKEVLESSKESINEKR